MIQLKASVAGAIKSKTVYLGLAIIIMEYLQLNSKSLEILLASFVSPEKLQAVMSLIGMALGMGVIVVRFLTDQALAEKGQK